MPDAADFAATDADPAPGPGASAPSARLARDPAALAARLRRLAEIYGRTGGAGGAVAAPGHGRPPPTVTRP